MLFVAGVVALAAFRAHAEPFNRRLFSAALAEAGQAPIDLISARAANLAEQLSDRELVDVHPLFHGSKVGESAIGVKGKGSRQGKYCPFQHSCQKGEPGLEVLATPPRPGSWAGWEARRYSAVPF